MPVWQVKSIDDNPEITLTDWTIFEVTSKLWPEKTRHLVGYNQAGREGRVSSAIVRFDNDKMRGQTRSGRIYQLHGPQGTGSPDGLHVWSLWCLRNEITDSRIVDSRQLLNYVAEAYEAMDDEHPTSREMTEEEAEQLEKTKDVLLKWFV
ncbi:hypothetical protein [Oryzomonas rubra]|uniref:Uncharacterized protein n=1 Tax=Oryzomonas rubra TaxID=2509454 RepID=A0A5A9X6Q6_9BACT|nr:hypothetical protein [Oryzomonas rubra]KAA0888128.1 hypothetical protein ET418_17175 [Oryzomonas rubra]